MNFRRVTVDDYTELCDWWKEHGWDAIPIDMLPTGLIIEDENGKKLVAGFVYIAGNAPVAYLEYVVTNPDNAPRESYRACDMLFDKMVDFLKASNIKACFGRLNSSGLVKMYRRHGFTDGDEVRDMVWMEK